MIWKCTRLNCILAPRFRKFGQLWPSNNEEDGDDNDDNDDDCGLSLEGDNREADKADEIWAVPHQKDKVWSDHLKNFFFGPKPLS